MRDARTTLNAPSHYLELVLIAKLLPHCLAQSPTEQLKVARGVARTLLELWERRYWQERDGKL